MPDLNQMTDTELKLWQWKQMDQCLIENTINKLIETYGYLEQSHDLRLYNERSQNLEESAIQMAISEHGLHQSSIFRLQMPELERERDSNQSNFYDMCGPSRLSHNLPTRNNEDSSVTNEYSDESNSTQDASHLLEAAVSVAIQKQGLGLSGLNR